MIDLSETRHHPAIEEIVDVLCHRTENNDRNFFRVEVAYFLAMMAGCMRATIVTQNRGSIPVNVYTVALATSGYGKGHSVGIMEDDFIGGFRKRFMSDTLPTIAEKSLWDIANERAVRMNTDPSEEFDKVQKEYRSLGPFAFAFDAGSSPAAKQMRQKLVIAGCGAMNLQIDEIGSYLSGSEEILNVYLELYDQGKVKQKLVKQTVDQQRGEDLEGKTPANMLLFGTPTKLFDGEKTESLFLSFLETGYARRCFFGYGMKETTPTARNVSSVKELYQELISPKNLANLTKWARHFDTLADPALVGWKMMVEEDVGIEWLTYKLWCEQRAAQFTQFQPTHKAEMEHRYSKAMKLAGAYAFVDGSTKVEMEHLKAAILLAEESGLAFSKILSRETPRERLGKYLAEVGHEVTQHDLMEALPFFKGSQAHRNDLISLATSWGWSNNVIIKKSYGPNNIEFYKGETLKRTNLDELRISYSDHWAYNYEGVEISHEQLPELVTADGMNWANHWFERGHRSKENAIPGFNLLVFDVDGGVQIEQVHELLKDITFFTYTTKRHRVGDNGDRFRLLIPTNYRLELADDEYKLLYDQVKEWLPFRSISPDIDLDESANQRSKKYLSHAGAQCHWNPGEGMLDILPFIPNTAKNDSYKKQFKAVENMDNLERWFASRMVDGDRNNQMIKYTLALVDAGFDFQTVAAQVQAFNAKLASPMEPEELERSVLVTAAKRIQKRAA